jgi:hypothetical protein
LASTFNPNVAPSEIETSCNLLTGQFEIALRVPHAPSQRVASVYQALLGYSLRAYSACKANPRSIAPAVQSQVQADSYTMSAHLSDYTAAITAP